MSTDYNAFTIKQLKQMVNDRKIIHIGLKKADYVKSLIRADEWKKAEEENDKAMNERFEKLDKTIEKLKETKQKFQEFCEKVVINSKKQNDEFGELEGKIDKNEADFQRMIFILKLKLGTCKIFSNSPLNVDNEIWEELTKFGLNEKPKEIMQE